MWCPFARILFDRQHWPCGRMAALIGNRISSTVLSLFSELEVDSIYVFNLDFAVIFLVRVLNQVISNFTMGPNRRCCVPGCKGGYESQKKRNKKLGIRNKSIFRPRTEAQSQKWSQALALLGREFSERDAVCEDHFPEGTISRYIDIKLKDGSIVKWERGVPELKPDACPTIFPSCTKNVTRKVTARKPPKKRQSSALPNPRGACGNNDSGLSVTQLDGLSLLAKEAEKKTPIDVLMGAVPLEDLVELKPGESAPSRDSLFSQGEIVDWIRGISLPGPNWATAVVSNSAVFLCVGLKFQCEKTIVVSENGNLLEVKVLIHGKEVYIPGLKILNLTDISRLLNVVNGFKICAGLSTQATYRERQTTIAVHSGKVIGHPAPDGDGAEGSEAKKHSTLQTTADGTLAVDGKKAVSRPVPGGDGAQVPAKRPRARKKAEDASSVGPSRKSPRVVPRKWPILPQEGVSVAESAISFQEVIHHDEEQESISMDESELDEGSSHLEKCRLCFMHLEDFTYIFEFHDAHHFHVGDVINDLMGLDVNPNDGYPSKICNYCLEELSHFRNFKRKCFETKARLGRIVEAGTDSEEDSEDAACPSGAGEIPVHSEAVESIVIKQEVDEPESHLQSESVINRSWNHASNSVEQVTVKEEVTSSSVDEVTFSEEFIIPDEPTSAGQANELTKPCQPISVSKVADRKEVMVPYQPMSVNSLTVNKEIMMPCQPSSVGKVTVKKKLMIPSQHTSVSKVTVRKELILPCGTAGDYNNDGGGEVMGRERVTQVQGKHITMEVPNVPHPQSGDPEVPADGFFVPVKVEVDSDGEEVGDNCGGLSGEGRMAS
ncbi:uncharacterized protein LOC124166949 isoform X2 [Ischnura elegans]|uniref:uncharacterized protein LOC124166949 isoform X2 n=1 Tax=Ischnura elegans TaxID=197161 RepID=UPI001ED875C4|nr:uncharacterized protein LOC124166949 isoform X2 [Ischnura elegans]